MPESAAKSNSGCIGILHGSKSDLSLLDFSIWGLRCFHIDSPSFESYIKENCTKKTFDRTWDLIKSWSKEDFRSNRKFWDSSNQYVLVPANLSNPASEYQVFDCRTALLVMFPSSISIRGIHYIDIQDEKIISAGAYSSYDPYPLYEGNHKYLQFTRRNIDKVNSFMTKYHSMASNSDSLQAALRFYVSAFLINDPLMSFVSFCIALETIVPARHEINFQIKRNLAVLCGDTKADSELIFKNVGNLYNLRSGIVHSDRTEKQIIRILQNENNSFDRYLHYIQVATSRMLIEMTLQECQDIKTFNEQLRAIGFGEKKSISKNYEDYIFNLMEYMTVFLNKDFLTI